MNDHEQLRPVYLDVNGDIIIVNSMWSEEDATYKIIMRGSEAALGCLYSNLSARACEDANGSSEIIVEEKGHTFSDLSELRRWMRDAMVEWQDAGAIPTVAPDPIASASATVEKEVGKEAEHETGDDKDPQKVPALAIFESITELREAVHFKSTDELNENLKDEETAAYTAPQDTDNSSVENEADAEADTESNTESGAMDDEDDWNGSEVTMIPSSRPVDAATSEGDDWEGTEQTVIPQSKTTSNNDGDDWDGAEATVLPQSKQADEDWDGAEQTMVGGGNAMDWDGAEATVVGQSAAEWVGDEDTMVGTAGLEAAVTGESSTSTRSRTGSRTGTNPSFNDGWYLMGDKGPCTGEIWGDYELGGILGAGGMGTVYRGRQFSLRRRVAIKVLPSHLQSDSQMRERFELEAQSASVLNSPHVVQVFAAGTENGNPYYVMEYVEGADLHELVIEQQKKGEMIDPHVAADYIIQAGRGLIEAQKHDFVHRDIKPPNLMLTKKGTVKIADFGIVKVLGESSMTMTGGVIGTPAYSAPEQGSGSGCDGRSDIYALGVVFYELLTLQKPFDGTTGNALIYQHNYTEPPMPTDVNPDCPASYQTVVLKCMQKNPDDRYQSAQELVEDLERVRLGTAPLAQVFGTGADAMMKAQGLSRKSWKRVLIPAAAILLCGIGLMLFLDYRETQKINIDRIAVLKENLKHLNDPDAPKDSDITDLNELSTLLNDEDVIRWNNKLSGITTMEESLRRLDDGDEPSADVLATARKDYDQYTAYVTGEGQAAQRWNRKLQQADQKMSRIRAEIAADLKVTDQALNVIIWGRVLPNLSILEKMAGTEDGDVIRWHVRHDKFESLVAELRKDLKQLDVKGARFPEQQVQSLTASLNTLSPKVDSRDTDVLSWRLTLAKLSGGLANLRKKLAVFDGAAATPYASQMLIASMEADMQRYQPLVDSDDLPLLRWQKKIIDSQAIMQGHSEWFVKNVDPVEGLLSVTIQEKARIRLNLIQPLFPEDDVSIERWGDILAASERRTENMQARLANVLEEDELPKDDIKRAKDTIEALEAIGGLVLTGETYAAKLRAYEKHHAELRARLQPYNKRISITKNMQADLSDFRRLLGTEDKEGETWRLKNAKFEEIHSSLLVLDLKTEFPDDSRERVNALIELVNVTDLDVIRWKGKLDRYDDLMEELDVLDDAMPVPDRAGALLDQLSTLIGDRSKKARRWREKVNRVIELKDILAILEESYVLPLGVDSKMEELVSLVGESDSDYLRWLPILTRLIGPAQPSWASDYGRDAYGLYAVVVIEDQSYRFRYVPAGKFNIGSDESVLGRDADEDQVPITLTKGFWIAEQECIQTLWTDVMWENLHPSKFAGGDRPVERISWNDAQLFLASLNERMGLTVGQARLPSEAEWEYACRVGNESASFIDDLGQMTDVNMVAWSYLNSDNQTWPVKQRVHNALGLFDMHGNVWEWCEDHYGGYPPAGAVDPKGGARKEYVIRGGSFYDYPDSCRAANRLGIDGDMQTMYVGFRIVISLDQDVQKNTAEDEPDSPIVDDTPNPKAPEDSDPIDRPAVKEEDSELAESHS